MQFSTLALTALLGLVSAQNTKVTVVQVGKNGTVFSPNNIKVNAGEMVQFQFMGGNHTVTQSTFDQPCQPVGANANATGFHSGFIPAAASQSMGMVPTYTIMINDTKPIWAYCAQAKHCQNGMVMVINENTSANATRSLNEFKKLAAGAEANVAPSGSGSSTGGTTGTTTGSPDGSSSGTPQTGASAGSMLTVPGALTLLGLTASAFLL